MSAVLTGVENVSRHPVTPFRRKEEEKQEELAKVEDRGRRHTKPELPLLARPPPSTGGAFCNARGGHTTMLNTQAKIRVC